MENFIVMNTLRPKVYESVRNGTKTLGFGGFWKGLQYLRMNIKTCLRREHTMEKGQLVG